MELEWVLTALQNEKQIFAAVVGPTGTGKSYLLNRLMDLMRSRGLVVAKLTPSSVATHLIGGTTIHNFFALVYSSGHRKVPVPFPFNGLSTHIIHVM